MFAGDLVLLLLWAHTQEKTKYDFTLSVQCCRLRYAGGTCVMCHDLIVAVLYALGGMLTLMHAYHTYDTCDDLMVLAVLRSLGETLPLMVTQGGVRVV